MLKNAVSVMILFILSILGIVSTLILIVLLIYSPGKPEKLFDNEKNPVGFSEKRFVTIGGIKQGMFIRSKNINNPVLLYVHGGPAFPNYFLAEKYKPGLEEYFTVCYWEQRGGGLSYHPNIPLESMTFEQLTFDAIEVSNYLRLRFKKNKIYIMAHSGGTPIALQSVVKKPQLYHAYIGMAQITDQLESEQIALNFIKTQYKAAGNAKALRKLEKFAVYETDTAFISFFKSPFRDKAMHELGIGTMRNMKSVVSGVFIPVWLCKAYTLKEKVNIWISKLKFVKKAQFADELFKMDIPELVPKLEIPVYFFSGKYDFTVNVDLSKGYLEKLEAPVKGFYTFQNSAHSPLFEEPERVKQIIETDVLQQKTYLADK